MTFPAGFSYFPLKIVVNTGCQGRQMCADWRRAARFINCECSCTCILWPTSIHAPQPWSSKGVSELFKHLWRMKQGTVWIRLLYFSRKSKGHAVAGKNKYGFNQHFKPSLVLKCWWLYSLKFVRLKANKPGEFYMCCSLNLYRAKTSAKIAVDLLWL